MASFPVSQRYGEHLRKQGFNIVPNVDVGTATTRSHGDRTHRPLRLVLNVSGREARRIWNDLFWATHKRVSDPYCECCSWVNPTYLNDQRAMP